MKLKSIHIFGGAFMFVSLIVWFVFRTDSAQQSRDNSKPAVERTVAVSAPRAVVEVSAVPEPTSSNALQKPPSATRERAFQLASSDPAAAMKEAEGIADEATRKSTMQDIMALWLRKDRLAAADWMTAKRGMLEYEPLSAQVSDAFFPDDTEMSAMFSFDLTDSNLRDTRVNKLVAYWKSGAHLRFDNSPWDVDGPGTSTQTPTSAPLAAPKTEAVGTSLTDPQS